MTRRLRLKSKGLHSFCYLVVHSLIGSTALDRKLPLVIVCVNSAARSKAIRAAVMWRYNSAPHSRRMPASVCISFSIARTTAYQRCRHFRERETDRWTCNDGVYEDQGPYSSSHRRSHALAA